MAFSSFSDTILAFFCPWCVLLEILWLRPCNAFLEGQNDQSKNFMIFSVGEGSKVVCW